MSGVQTSIKCPKCEAYTIVPEDAGNKLWTIACSACGWIRERPKYAIKCPKCQAHTIAQMEYAGSKGAYREPRWGARLGRVACSACGLIREYGPDETAEYELWYATEIFGQRLWAVNRSHLSFLIAWFSNKKRRRLPYPERVEVEIFPKWMILAKHRIRVLNALERMAKS